jgi:GNAT superfamily N-acetyltransferase
VSDYRIREIDKHDESVLHEWWRVGRQASADRAYDVYPTWEHSRVALVEDNPEHDLALLAAYDGSAGADVMVGIAAVELPLLDNTHSAWIDVGVPPARRGRGVGSALLADVERRVGAAGRTHSIAAAFTPPGEPSPGSRFAARHGYEVANTEGFKVLDLRDHPDWGPLDERVAARIGDYRVVEWDTHTPAELVPDLARAISTFVSMVPTGDLALEDGEWTPERYLDNERRFAKSGRTFAAAALAPDGELAGYTGLTVSRAMTTQASVGITFVLPGHRGHALGLAVKLANHRALTAALPECEIVRTSNADVNDHMNAVNEAMGYRLVEDVLEVQMVL